MTVEDIIKELRHKAWEQRQSYFAKHPRAQYLSDNIEGVVWAFEHYAGLLCGRELSHDVPLWGDDPYKRQCARCGDWEFYQEKVKV